MKSKSTDIQEFKENQEYWRHLNTIRRTKSTPPYDPKIVLEYEITGDEISAAFHKWRGELYPHDSAERAILDFICAKRSVDPKQTRQALFLKANDVAKRMGVSKSKFSKMEKAVEAEKCTISEMRAMAAAMDCELVYAVRPKEGKLFSERLWVKVLPEALWRLAHRFCNPKNKSGGLAAAALELVRDPDFRHKQNWSRNE